MKQNNLKQLQQKSLELLQTLDEFCKKHNKKIFVIGGGLIGAVRHGGFIPWDDDLDVFMLREDYEWLCENFNSLIGIDNLYFEKTTKEHYTRLQIGAVVDENTTFIKERQKDLKDVHHGIRIDIIPLDNCPKSKFKRKTQILWALLYSMFIVGEPHSSKGKFLEIISKILLAFFPTAKSRYKVWRLAEKRMSRFKKGEKLTELCSWYQYMKNEYDTKWFSEVVYLDFENAKIPAPIGYDEYLKMAFGDYMTPPPENEQIPKHDAVKIDVNRSYKGYFGENND
ncbi:MAG: LicD family protein [Clostridia bacterium]|nr:LicD family protein [Clostridia bacterium]